jgi:hypothetical protein
MNIKILFNFRVTIDLSLLQIIYEKKTDAFIEFEYSC